MRSYCAVFVDVGYLVASSATYVTGSSLRRGVTIDYPALIDGIVAQAQQDSDLPLLRVNWYDSGGRPGGMPDFQQEEIGGLPRVKLRLGRLSYSGDQKGVDVRIGLDLAIQGRHRVADVIYLISGDDDLTEAVEEAQGHGVQVVLLAVPDQRGGAHGVSKHLRREVDEVLAIDPAMIAETVRPAAIPDALVPEPALAGDADSTVAGADAEPARPAETRTPTPSAGSGPVTGPADDASIPADDAATDARPAAVRGLQDAPADAPAEPALPSERADAAGRPVGRTPAPHDTRGPAAPESSERQASDAPAALPVGPPSPAVLASRKATTISLPGLSGGPLTADDLRAPAYDPLTGVTPGLVDAVAKRVVHSWSSTATPDSLASLRRNQPTLPGELDRALLLDLSGAADGAEIDDAARTQVRERFWFHVRRLRLS